MEVDVYAVHEEINFAPENVVEEVVQNVRTICTTPKYSVPMDRLFGIDGAILDSPTPKAMAVIWTAGLS